MRSRSVTLGDCGVIVGDDRVRPGARRARGGCMALSHRVAGRMIGRYVAAALAGVAMIGPATPAVAAPDAPPAASGHGPWRFDATATGLTDVARSIGADRLWRAGDTGRGVGVALVDTGVAPVEGLRSVVH